FTHPPSFLDGRSTRLVNGRIRKQPVSELVGAWMDDRKPEVLVLGDSLANTNVDGSTLADALDMPRRKVLRVSLPNSVPAHWYALLEHQVYDRGLRVPLVIVVAPFPSLVVVEPYSEISRRSLDALLAPTEPVLDRFVDRRPSIWDRYERNRS